MTPPNPLTRRRFLERSFAFSAASMLAGCSGGITALGGSGSADPVAGGTAHFLAVGDYGEIVVPNGQAEVAFGMQKYVTKYSLSPDALLMLGDNFYGSLHGGAQSARWQTQFENMYPANSFPGPALAVPGNHDYQVAPVAKYPAELQYALQNESRWTMPAQFYRTIFPATGPGLVTVIALDSNMPNEPAQPIPPDTSYYTMTNQQRLDQLAALEDLLSQPLTTPWLVVVAHHPLYSNGPHGDNQTLIRDWDPLFRKYNVHMYMAGHDHDLQHLEFAGHPTSFVCSGGGGSALAKEVSSKASRGPYFAETYGFTHLQVKPEMMILRHLDQNANLLHKFTKTLDGAVTINK